MLYLILVPAGVVIGHIGIAAKIMPKVLWLDVTSRWLAQLWCAGVLICWLARVRQLSTFVLQGPFDTALSLALVTMIVAIVWEHVGRRRVALTPLAALVSAAIMGRGRTFVPARELTNLDPSWLVLAHALLAYFAFGVLALNSFCALRLILGKGEKPPELSRWLGVSLKLGFAAYSVMIVSGLLTSFFWRGVGWSFDPIECMALVVWSLLGFVVLVHRSGRWPEKRIAAICFVFFFIVVASFRLVDYLPQGSSFHIFPVQENSH